MSKQYQRDSGCAAMGVSVIFVSRDGCVTSFLLAVMGVVAGLGAVDARANGTTDQGTRATKNDARAEATANMEHTDACQPPKWKCRTPVTHELGSAGPPAPANVEFKRRTWLFSGSKWLAVALCGFSELFNGSEWLFRQRSVAHFFFLKSGSTVARSGSTVAFSGSTVAQQ